MIEQLNIVLHLIKRDFLIGVIDNQYLNCRRFRGLISELLLITMDYITAGNSINNTDEKLIGESCENRSNLQENCVAL